MFLNIKMDEKDIAKGKENVIILKVPSFTDYPNLSLARSTVSQVIRNQRSDGLLSCPWRGLTFCPSVSLTWWAIATAAQVSGSGSKDFCQTEILKKLRNRLPLRYALSCRGSGSTTCLLPPDPGLTRTRRPRHSPPRPCSGPVQSSTMLHPHPRFFPQSRQCGIVIRYKLKVYFLPFSNYTALW